uniref:Ubiquinol-cytochrome c reductase complex assembly factor 5 n=1 Tax=Canis lupus dingo TaxID=286419 RepID=A0A8C0JL09_CANLU
MFSRAQVRRVLQRVPGKQRLGVYRFLPFFFVLGGTMEWIMIKLRVGQETFYDVYRRKASERQYQRRLENASETELQPSIKFSRLYAWRMLRVSRSIKSRRRQRASAMVVWAPLLFSQ